MTKKIFIETDEPDLEDVYTDNDWFDTEPVELILNASELRQIYDNLELHWYTYMLTKDAEDEWYSVNDSSLNGRKFDINISEIIIVSDTVKCATAVLYECHKDNDVWKTNTENYYTLFEGRYYKEITEWQRKRLPKKRKLRERVGY